MADSTASLPRLAAPAVDATTSNKAARVTRHVRMGLTMPPPDLRIRRESYSITRRISSNPLLILNIYGFYTTAERLRRTPNLTLIAHIANPIVQEAPPTTARDITLMCARAPTGIVKPSAIGPPTGRTPLPSCSRAINCRRRCKWKCWKTRHNFCW